MSKYLIQIREQELYIHYNPHTRAYFLGDTRVGACIFHADQAEGFITTSGIPELVRVEVSVIKRIQQDRSVEKALFDVTH